MSWYPNPTMKIWSNFFSSSSSSVRKSFSYVRWSVDLCCFLYSSVMASSTFTPSLHCKKGNSLSMWIFMLMERIRKTLQLPAKVRIQLPSFLHHNGQLRFLLKTLSLSFAFWALVWAFVFVSSKYCQREGF